MSPEAGSRSSSGSRDRIGGIRNRGTGRQYGRHSRRALAGAASMRLGCRSSTGCTAPRKSGLWWALSATRRSTDLFVSSGSGKTRSLWSRPSRTVRWIPTHSATCSETTTRAPTIVCAAAGNVNTGACDDMTAVVEAAHAVGAWVHVDGAFGLWAAASPRTAHLVRGIELADSWACDGHKWLNVPYDAGMRSVHTRRSMRRHWRTRRRI